jgi:hypothetical protein
MLRASPDSLSSWRDEFPTSFIVDPGPVVGRARAVGVLTMLVARGRSGLEGFRRWFFITSDLILVGSHL